jgi:hypothetical protein
MKAILAGVTRRAKNVFYDVARISWQMTASYRTAVKGKMLATEQIKWENGKWLWFWYKEDPGTFMSCEYLTEESEKCLLL